VADFTILLAIVETCLAHAALPLPVLKHPPAGAKWQSCTATEIKAGAVMTAAKRASGYSPAQPENIIGGFRYP
jgi:hypothetical protein